MTSPSVGTRSPGRCATTSPMRSSLTGTSCSVANDGGVGAAIRRAVCGARLSNLRKALDAERSHVIQSNARC